MAKYDKHNAEKWLNEHHFGYYNSEDDKGTGSEEIPTINRVFEAWDDEADWLTADPVDQDREHANLYGGDREYCDECGRRLTMGEWGGYCSHCHPDYEDYEDEYLDDDDTTSEWKLIDRKNVEDSDGFITEYSWYQRGDEHVMVFGDSDIYRPEDGDYDAEFDSEERAREWFSSYEGFTDHNEGIDKDRFNCLEDECEERTLTEAKTYRGIPNTTYVYHGDWADPEVYINGKGFSEWDVEEYIWGDYVEACEDNGEEPTDEGFDKYCEEHGEDLCNSFYYSNLEFMSTKEIVEEIKEFADDSLGAIYMVTDNYVEVIFNYPGHTNGADEFIKDIENSYLGKEGLAKCEKLNNSTGDPLDADDYEPEVLVRVTAMPNSLSEDIDEDALEELEEAFEEEDKPFTKSQIRDELRRETNQWTKASDEIYYGFESEYEYAMTVLKKHYKEVSGEETGNRYTIRFSNPTKKLKESVTGKSLSKNELMSAIDTACSVSKHSDAIESILKKHNANDDDTNSELGYFSGMSRTDLVNAYDEIREYFINHYRPDYEECPSKLIDLFGIDAPIEESYSHFEFTSGSNPYIAKTEEEKKRLCNKWGKDCEFKGNINGNDYYVINDKPVENDFAPSDLDEALSVSETDRDVVDDMTTVLYSLKGLTEEDLAKIESIGYKTTFKGKSAPVKLDGVEIRVVTNTYEDGSTDISLDIGDDKDLIFCGRIDGESTTDKIVSTINKWLSNGSINENKEDDLYDYKTRQATGDWDRDDDDYLLNQESKAYHVKHGFGKWCPECGGTDIANADPDWNGLVGVCSTCGTELFYVIEQDIWAYDLGNSDSIDESIKSPDAVNKALKKFRGESDGCYDKLSKDEEERLDTTGNLTDSTPTNEAFGGESVERFLSSKVVTVDGVTGIDPKVVSRNTMPRGCYITSSSLLGGRVYDHGTLRWKGTDYVFRVRKDGSVKVMTDAQAGSNWSETIFKESKQLNEGPGAGYTLEGKIKISGIETLKPVKYDICNDFGYKNSYDVTFDCVGIGTIEDFKFDSYMYGDTIDSANIDISAVRVNIWKEDGFENIEEFVKSNLEYIKNCIVGARVESSHVYGGGYIHSKFDGTICEVDEILNNSYSDEFGEVCTELFAMDATIRDTDIIEYVDKAVTGDNYYDRYEVMVDGDCIEDFETESEAIEYAKKDPDADEVVRVSYHEMFNGDLDIEESETVWEREDDDFEESFKSIPGGKAIMESLVKSTLENYPNASSKVIARKTFDKSFEKHNITFEKWHKLVESVNKK